MADSISHQIHSLPTDREIEYPESDGKPMAETDVHRNLMIDFIQMLKAHFQSESDIYVSGNLLLYYEKGNPRRSVAPDVFVVKGIENRQRRNYLLWEEGKSPDFVLELSSATTYRHDLNRKKRLYAQVLEVEEYFLYDPNHQYLNPPLQGYRLVDGTYVEIAPVEDRLPSQVLGLELGLKTEGDLGLYNPHTQTWLLPPEERANQAEARADQAEAKADQAEALAQQESLARQQAEAELERLRAELQRRSTQSPKDQ